MAELHVAFGGGGIKSFLLENVLGALQARASRTVKTQVKWPSTHPYRSMLQDNKTSTTRTRVNSSFLLPGNAFTTCMSSFLAPACMHHQCTYKI